MANIFGLVVHDDSNNTCSIYTWDKFEGNIGIKHIDSCLLRWMNDKGYYNKLYGKKNKIPEISILIKNCGGQNKNNAMIRFPNMIKEG